MVSVHNIHNIKIALEISYQYSIDVKMDQTVIWYNMSSNVRYLISNFDNLYTNKMCHHKQIVTRSVLRGIYNFMALNVRNISDMVDGTDK